LPKLAEVAAALHLPERTPIRRLRRMDTRYTHHPGRADH
jgi:hypothetical protein